MDIPCSLIIIPESLSVILYTYLMLRYMVRKKTSRRINSRIHVYKQQKVHKLYVVLRPFGDISATSRQTEKDHAGTVMVIRLINIHDKTSC